MSAKSISQKNKWLTVVNSMDPNEPAELVISGFIGESMWDDTGNSAKDFRESINSIPKGRKITLKINSEGGVVKDALEMYSCIESRSSDVTANIIGYACSSASWLGLAADKVRTQDNAIWMIHNSSSYTCGNEADHLKSAKMLATHDDSIAGMLAKKTGKSMDAIKADMASEKWMTGAEAKDYGLADESEKGATNAIQGVAVNSPWMAKLPERFKTLAAPSPGTTNNSPGRKDPDNALTPDTQGAANSISVGLVANGGTSTAAGNTQTTENIMADTTTAAVTPPANDTNRIAALEAQVQNERKSRLTQTVNSYIDRNAIVKDEATLWVNAMSTDEAGTVKILDAKLPKTENSQLGSTVTVVADTPFDKIKVLPTAKARYTELRNNWDGMIQDAFARDARRPNVTNANTYSSTLITSFLIDGAVTVLQNRWAPLMAFTRDFTVDPYKPLASGQLKTVTAGPTVQTGAASAPITNYESGDATVGVTTVNVLEYCSSFHVSSTELNSGLRMENLMQIGVAKLADSIIQAATAPITLANYTVDWTGGSTNVCTAANFGFDDLATLWGSLQKSPIKNLILDGAYLAKLLNVPTYFQSYGTAEGAWKAFGWDLIALNSNWAGASNNAVGFACGPQAIACIAGLPLQPPTIPGNTLQLGTFVVPEVGMGVQTAQWFSLASRTGWFSYGAMFGAAKCDASAGRVICSS